MLYTIETTLYFTTKILRDLCKVCETTMRDHLGVKLSTGNLSLQRHIQSYFELKGRYTYEGLVTEAS
jgi:hypothetical protein